MKLDICFNDLGEIKETIRKYAGLSFYGTDSYEDFVVIHVLEDKIETHTFQKNGWVRINCFYEDGTIEELYER